VEPIPDAWPRAAGLTIAPLFPLPGFFLYPGTVVPLHIFEPRYRQMIEDMLDGPGRLVMGSVMEGHESELAGSPPVFPMGGLGEIGRHERLPDGRFNILLVGISRVRMHEVESDRAYRKVEIEPQEEIAVPEKKERAIRDALHKAILARCNEFMNLPQQMSISNLADLLIQRMELPRATIERLYAELDVAKRAEGALAEHAQLPLPPNPKPGHSGSKAPPDPAPGHPGSNAPPDPTPGDPRSNAPPDPDRPQA
jgi:Lon protease-like protein